MNETRINEINETLKKLEEKIDKLDSKIDKLLKHEQFVDNLSNSGVVKTIKFANSIIKSMDPRRLIHNKQDNYLLNTS